MSSGLAEKKDLQDALAVVPAAKMWNDVQYLYNTLLPALEKTNGKDSKEWVLFRGIVDSLLWAVYTMNKYEKLLLQYSNSRFLEQCYRDKMLLYESELLRYQTAEDLIKTDSYKDYADAIMKQAEAMLQIKK